MLRHRLTTSVLVWSACVLIWEICGWSIVILGWNGAAVSARFKSDGHRIEYVKKVQMRENEM